MAITWVQGVVGTMGAASGVSSASATLASTVGSGHCVVVSITDSTANFSDLTSVTDNKGNTYSLIAEVSTGSTGRIWLYFLANITNGPQTITANFVASSASFPQVMCDEYSGAVAIAGSQTNFQSNPGTGTDAITSGSFTPSASGTTIYGVSANSNGTITTAVGTGFTGRTADATNGDWGLHSEDKSASAGANTATFTDATNGGADGYLTIAIALSSTAFVDWGDELRGRQARRVPWRSRILSPDDISGFPFTVVATPTNWADVEQYVGPKRRRIWHPPTQPDGLIILPSAPPVFVEWGDELRGRQIRRVWHPLAQPDGLIVIPPAPPWGWEEVRGIMVRRPWRPRSQTEDLIIIPVAALVTFVEWGDELRGRQRRRVSWRSTILNPEEWFLPFFPPPPPPPPPSTSILLSYQYRWGDLFSQWNTGQITIQQYYFSLYALQWYFSGATDWNTSFRPRAAPGDLPAFPLIPPVYVGSSQPTTPTNFAGNSTDRVVDAATLVNTARTLRSLGCPPKAFPAPYPPRWAFQFYGGR